MIPDNGFWKMPLGEPPRLINLSSGAPHGLVPEETYFFRRIWVLNLHQGSGELDFEGQRFAFGKNSITLAPPGVRHTYRFAGPCRLSFIHFIPRGGTRAELPVTADQGHEADALRQRIALAATRPSLDHPATRSFVWDILWRLHESCFSARQNGENHHRAIQLTLLEIESRLSGTIYTEELARHAGISKTHLNRLFHRHLKCGVQEYIIAQRCKKALSLLRETSLSIQEIGSLVGIPDPHFFNKTFRRLHGKSPAKARKP
ncbi:helix-turn-helix domain-containing protein [Oscillatoria amoena NRMC-F 0135]|nr:helix-turn-helix domain-containing protein [Oscillatoria amoena NRMC-F 0135]